ncbi:uncharacterized protein LOC128232854 [Mya arenaria]|uniref:uncharacterized protein LOC128232854 n=1 Tax=Mya arenaria TaxID=6604 RepID=UPI0022E65544|nr:uncharacterized protein LOC128232854 [Mya arenaria]
MENLVRNSGERSMSRQSSVQGLAQQTKGFVRAYSSGDLEETERGLEEEIIRETGCARTGNLARLRHRGEMVLHSKQVLLAVVILNLVDCCLVLGELVLDIHYVKELRHETEYTSAKFIVEMESRYPDVIHGHSIDDIGRLYSEIYKAQCFWPSGKNHLPTTQALAEHRRYNRDVETYSTSTPPVYNQNVSVLGQSNKQQNSSAADSHDLKELLNHLGGHSLMEDIAHGLHKASITILGILFVENLLKLFCMGKTFFIKKLEVFDAFIVVVSFVVDLVLLKGLTEFPVPDALYILSFLLPWRVIRVVNSLLVAVLDHEHFRLKMLYREKKAVDAQLKILKDKEKRWDFHLQRIESFCESEGIPKWKIRQHTAMGRKQSTVSSMASLAFNGFLQGMLLRPSDKKSVKSSVSQSIDECTSDVALSTNTNCEVIHEGDNEDVNCNRHNSTTESELDLLTVDERETAEPTFRAKRTKRVSFDAKEGKPLLKYQTAVDVSEDDLSRQSSQDDSVFTEERKDIT